MVGMDRYLFGPGPGGCQRDLERLAEDWSGQEERILRHVAEVLSWRRRLWLWDDLVERGSEVY